MGLFLKFEDRSKFFLGSFGIVNPPSYNQRIVVTVLQENFVRQITPQNFIKSA